MKVLSLFAKDAIRHAVALRAEHLFIVTDDGRVFERFSDDEPGARNEVPLPTKRKRKQVKNSR